MRQIQAAYAARLGSAYAELARAGRVLCDVPLVAPDGGLLLDPESGLPSRIDFVQIGAGETEGTTVEVSSEEDDPIEGAAGTEGPVALRLGPARWDALRVELQFAAALSDAHRRDLVHLLHGWYQVGFFGGFGGEGRGCVHALRDLTVAGPEATFTLDLGSASLRALEALVELLEAFCSIAQLVEIRLGQR